MNRSIIFLAFALTALVGCNKELEPAEEGVGKVSDLTFIAMNETSEDDTKVTMSADGSIYNLHWNNQDRVYVTDGTISAVYSAAPTSGKPTEALLSTTSEITPSSTASSYYAIYPADDASYATKDGFTVNVPATQRWRSGGKVDVPRIGYSGADRKLSFKNVVSVLKISPKNWCDSYDGLRVERIEVTSDLDDIAGLMELSYKGEGTPELISTKTPSKKIILECNGEATFEDDFFVNLIPGAYKGDLTVKVISNGGGSQTFVIPEGKKYNRSKYSTLTCNVTNLAIYEPANCYLVKHAATYKFPVNIKGNGVLTVYDNNKKEDVVVISSASNNVDNIKNISSLVISQKDKNYGSFDQSLTLKDIKLDGDYITFTVPKNFTPGNVIIGIHNAEGGTLTDGSCMWSWHIWVNSEVDDVSLGSLHGSIGEVEVMNMNLGSLQTKSNLASYAGVNSGLYYQWGRKDPFPPYNGADATLPSSYTKDKCSDASKHRASEGVVMHYPVDFVSGNEVGKEVRTWCTNPYRDHWGAPPATNNKPGLATHTDQLKTAFDPCPPGYQVMSAFAWKMISYNFSNGTDSYAKRNLMDYYTGYMQTTKGSKPVFPYDGFRTPGTKTNYNTLGNLEGRNSTPYYWTASYQGTMRGAGVSHLEVTPAEDGKTFEVAGYVASYKSYACSVRAQKQ